eukprot:6473154-Amphidinium_carterae.1
MASVAWLCSIPQACLSSLNKSMRDWSGLVGACLAISSQPRGELLPVAPSISQPIIHVHQSEELELQYQVNAAF